MKSFATTATITLATAFLAGRQVTAQACQSQGTGNCQLYFTGDHIYPTSFEGMDRMLWQHATIYNWRCDVIGGLDNPRSGVAIYSQLPYTVVVDSIGDNAFDISRIGFRYGGYSFKGDFWCSEENGGTHSAVRCVHAFPC